MSFRQSGQSDDRRRRVLREDRAAKRPTRDSESTVASTGADAGVAAGDDVKTARPEGAIRRFDRPKATKRRAYTAAALVEGQLRLIDLIPVRAWTLSVLILLTLTAISALAVLYLEWPKWGRWLGRENLAFVDLAVRDSLAGWFSAMLLAIAACQSLFIYSLRRYRADDYRGRYRIWLTACAIVLLASADAVSGWGRGLCGLATHLGAIGGNISPESCGRLVWTIVFAVGAGRMLIEMRRSLAAVGLLVTAGACYACSLVLLSPDLNIASRQLAVLGRATCLLLGHASLLFSALFYARRVFLEAHGQIAAPLAGETTKRKRKTATGKKSASNARPADAKASAEITKVAAKKEEKTQPTAETRSAALQQPAPAKTSTAAPAAASSSANSSSAASSPAASSSAKSAPVAQAPAPKPAESAPARLSPLARLLGKGKKDAAADTASTGKAPTDKPSTDKASTEKQSAKTAAKPVEKVAGKPTSVPIAKPGLNVKSVDDDDEQDDDSDADDGTSKLSKAERRRLRKEQRRDRRAAA